MQGVAPGDGQPDRSLDYAAAAGRRRSRLQEAAASASEPKPEDEEAFDDDAWIGLEHTSEETRALYSPQARRVCLRAAVAEVCFGVLLLVSFWAAYGWSVVVAGLSIVLGTVGYSHYQTPDSIASNACCCQPVSFIHQQTYMHLILAAMSLASVASSIVAAVLASSAAVRAFAIIAGAASLGTGLSGLASHVFSADLVRFCVAAQADAENAHVIVVQPRHGGSDDDGRQHPGGAFASAGHAGMQQPGPYTQQQQHQQQQPMYQQQHGGHAFMQPPQPGFNPYAPSQQLAWHQPQQGPYASGPHGYPVAAARPAPAGAMVAQPSGLPPGAFVVYPVGHGDYNNTHGDVGGHAATGQDAALAVPTAAAEDTEPAAAAIADDDEDDGVVSVDAVDVEAERPWQF
jgi:hypothetical protein